MGRGLCRVAAEVCCQRRERMEASGGGEREERGERLEDAWLFGDELEMGGWVTGASRRSTRDALSGIQV